MDYIRKIKDELMSSAKKHPRHLNVEGISRLSSVANGVSVLSSI